MKAIQNQPFKNFQPQVQTVETTNDFDVRAAQIPTMEIAEGKYVVRFARTNEEINAALRLRFEVFNLELREGLESSYLTGRDEDQFDATCHHLIVLEQKSGAVIGTYRLQTLEMAGGAANFYCFDEFKLEDLPPTVLGESIEIGRACIAREHRNTNVLFLLWKGLAAFANLRRKRYFFGCCSLTSQNCEEGAAAARLLEREHHFHDDFYINPRDQYVCETKENCEPEEFELPKLFHTYLRFGAKVCSPPAIDRRFKTIDFFVLFDNKTINEKYWKLLFS